MYENGVQIQRMFIVLLIVAVVSASHSIEKRSGRCILPPYPKDGSYEVAGYPTAKPGDDPEYAYLNVSCKQGNGVVGNNVVLCAQGEWSTSMPQCVPVCYLKQHAGVKYTCQRLGAEDYKLCSEYEPNGTSIKAECEDGYYNPGFNSVMLCVDRTLTNQVRCTPDCGRLPEGATTLPWYVYIYKKTFESKYQPYCAGSIVSKTVILSVAHCFWSGLKKLNISGYVAVTGNSRLVLDPTQKTYPVSDVKIPDRFQGQDAHYQDDIAVVILSTPVEYSIHVKPVCLDFDHSFQVRQMQNGSLGTLAAWNDPMTNRHHSSLEVQQIPYIPISECISEAPPSFRQYLTHDKFCAGRKNGTYICKGNSGAGLVYPSGERGGTRYYLRGVVSTSHVSNSETACIPSDFVAFTGVYYHSHFIKKHLV